MVLRLPYGISAVVPYAGGVPADCSRSIMFMYVECSVLAVSWSRDLYYAAIRVLENLNSLMELTTMI
ncbi:hypothetical protein J6590_089040 [Homalodisca vitripennis]|nr:hypothetical protein J6590_089040 [Homalodisca vitripennis]